MWSTAQGAELDHLSRTHSKPGMRLKAVAVRAVGEGHTRQQVGAILHVSPYTVGRWCRAYQQGGWAALEIHPGRGRPSRVEAREVEEYVRQSPRNFGLPRTRWTLQWLAQKVPSLAGMRPPSVWQALRRLGISYKRAAPGLTSPDPDDVKKNAISRHSSPRRARSRKR
jgi:transposase